MTNVRTDGAEAGLLDRYEKRDTALSECCAVPDILGLNDSRQRRVPTPRGELENITSLSD